MEYPGKRSRIREEERKNWLITGMTLKLSFFTYSAIDLNASHLHARCSSECIDHWHSMASTAMHKWNNNNDNDGDLMMMVLVARTSLTREKKSLKNKISLLLSISLYYLHTCYLYNIFRVIRLYNKWAHIVMDR